MPEEVDPPPVVGMVELLVEIEIEIDILHQLDDLRAEIESMADRLRILRKSQVGSAERWIPRSRIQVPPCGIDLRIEEVKPRILAQTLVDLLQRPGVVQERALRALARREPALMQVQGDRLGRHAGKLVVVRHPLERLEYRVKPQHSVALELRLVEPLIGRRLVGELLVLRRIAEHIGRLVAGDRGLQVEKRSDMPPRIDLVVADSAHRAVPLAVAMLVAMTDRLDTDLDIDSKIRTAFLDCIPQIVELEKPVLPGIGGNDQPTAAAHKLVEPKVLEVPAVGEINMRVLVVGQPEKLHQQMRGEHAWPGALPSPAVTRVADPPAEPDVEDRHQERKGRR